MVEEERIAFINKLKEENYPQEYIDNSFIISMQKTKYYKPNSSVLLFEGLTLKSADYSIIIPSNISNLLSYIRRTEWEDTGKMFDLHKNESKHFYIYITNPLLERLYNDLIKENYDIEIIEEVFNEKLHNFC